MRDLPRSTNSPLAAGRPWRDVAMVRPEPSLLPRQSTSPTAATAGTTQRPSRMPTLDVTTLGVTTDAGAMFGKSAPGSSGAVGEVEKGRNEIVSALFHGNLVSKSARRLLPAVWPA